LYKGGEEMILCCGEALIDMVPGMTENRDTAFVPCPGGSPYNAAIALARMGVDAGFLSPLSKDFFGDLLYATLQKEGVDLSLVRRVDKPSTLAFVQLKEGHEPEYAFFFENTADRSLTVETLPPRLPDSVTALLFGSISLTMEPGATAISALIDREADQRVISFDPNIRSSMISNRESYHQRLEDWARAAAIVKVSEADLAYLYPQQGPKEALETLLSAAWPGRATRPLLGVVTLGSRGAWAVLRTTQGRTEASVDGLSISVRDTIGAGDTFHAGFLASLSHQGYLSREALPRLSSAQLGHALRSANAAAALACTRKGADPPNEAEVQALLNKF
jgi:fructokinase